MADEKTDNDAIAAAVADATKEAGAEPEVEAKVEATGSEPKQEAEPTAAKVTPTAKVEEQIEEEEVFTPTAEDLALIDKSPELKKVYRSMQKGLTQKSQKYAELTKQHRDEVEIANWIRSNPQEAARTLAASTGMTISEAKAAVADVNTVKDELQEEWDKVVGPDAAKLLRPLLEKTAERVAAKNLAPYQEQTEALARAATERGIAASLREFAAEVVERGEEFDDDLQGVMADILGKVHPDENTPIEDVLNIAYNSAVAHRNRERTARANLSRLRKSREESEPFNTSRPAGKSEGRITLDMNDRDAVNEAVRQAQNEIGRR